MKASYLSITTTTTTVAAEKIRGFSLDVLAELSTWGGLTGSEIAELLSKPKKYVRVYLWRLYKYGCIDRRLYYGWEITPFGVDILNSNCLNKYNIGNRRITERQQKDNRRITDEKHLRHSTRQLYIDLFLENEDLSEDQRVVVVVLAQHYEKTGRPYVMVKDYYELRELMGLDPSLDVAELQDLVISLDVCGMIYSFQRGRFLKIGLLKRVIENMKYC